MTEQWIVDPPGGPNGPFYSVVASSGRVVALRIPDGKIAAQISNIPAWLEQDQRIVNDLKMIRYALTDGSDAEIREALSLLNFWINVYDREHDG
jgi:hypothetical protein